MFEGVGKSIKDELAIDSKGLVFRIGAFIKIFVVKVRIESR